MTLPTLLLLVAAVDILVACAAFERRQMWASGFLTGVGFCCAGTGMIGVGFLLTSN